jgi:hypothetical protein
VRTWNVNSPTAFCPKEVNSVHSHPSPWWWRQQLLRNVSFLLRDCTAQCPQMTLICMIATVITRNL